MVHDVRRHRAAARRRIRHSFAWKRWKVKRTHLRRYYGKKWVSQLDRLLILRMQVTNKRSTNLADIRFAICIDSRRNRQRPMSLQEIDVVVDL